MTETSGNQMELSQVNMVDEATIPSQALAVWHLLPLQHVVWHCHAGSIQYFVTL